MSRKSYKKSRINKISSNIKQPKVAKTKTITTRDSFKETLKLVKQANSRLTKLKQAGYKTGTWSSKKLNTRLQTNKIGAWHRGRIKVREDMTETQLKAIQKATKQFLTSKTSTPKGINKVRKNTIDSLSRTLSEEDKPKLSYEDAEFYYDMLGEDDFDFFADKRGASTVWAWIDDAIDNGDTLDGWLDRLSDYVNINDEDVRFRATRLYNKYIS